MIKSTIIKFFFKKEKNRKVVLKDLKKYSTNLGEFLLL